MNTFIDVINHALQYLVKWHSNLLFLPLVNREEILVLLRTVFHVLTAAIQDDPANKNFMDEVLSDFASIFIFLTEFSVHSAQSRHPNVYKHCEFLLSGMQLIDASQLTMNHIPHHWTFAVYNDLKSEVSTCTRLDNTRRTFCINTVSKIDNKYLWGDFFVSVCLSVCLSVHPSVSQPILHVISQSISYKVITNNY